MSGWGETRRTRTKKKEKKLEGHQESEEVQTERKQGERKNRGLKRKKGVDFSEEECRKCG